MKRKRSLYVIILAVILFILLVMFPLFYNYINHNIDFICNFINFPKITIKLFQGLFYKNHNNIKGIELLTYCPHETALKNDKYSIIIPTYSKRKNVLSSSLQSFIQEKSIYLEEIFIIWCDKNRSIKIPNISDYNISDNNEIKITIIDSINRLITGRFLIPSTIKTSYILSMDDDIFVNPLKIDKLFAKILKNNITKQIVGPTSRACKDDFYLAFHQQNYSMILTNFAFLHIDMFELFNKPQYKHLVEFVANQNNGEDILMNYIVTSNYRLPPIRAHIKTLHISEDGISTDDYHFIKRNECCIRFHKYFQNEGLLFSTQRI